MIPSFLLQKEQINIERKAVKYKLSFVDRTAKNSATFITASCYQWYASNKSGLLQSIDPRIKVFFLFGFALLISFTHIFISQLIISSIIFLLFFLSKLKLINAYKKIVFLGFVFGFLIFIPASLNIFNQGQPFITLVRFSEEHYWWIYRIPKEISITYEGIQGVLRLTLKVINSISVVMLVISTTTFERIIKSLSFFKVPGIFLLTLTMSYKYIFILSQTVEETYRGLKMRWWNRGSLVDAEEIVAGRIGYLFRKSWERYEMIYQSMTARGFNGTVNFYYFEKLKSTDYLFAGIILIVVFSIIIINSFYA